jgi:anti-sigma B factor antagonist
LADGLKGTYEVAVGGRAVYVRVHGLGSMNNCLCVRDFLDTMLSSGRGFVVMDMKDCTGMDSTFMGVIAGVATQEIEDRPVGVAIVNAGDDVTKLLEGVGLTELVFVDPEAFEADDAEFHILEEQSSEADRLRLIRSAHEHLISLSDDNEKVFGDLVRTIEMEMKNRGLLPE